MEGQYNLESPAVKRLMREAKDLQEPTEQYYAQPLEDNLFEWHFTIRGASGSDYKGGIYHGRITLPSDYPTRAPSLVFLTPNGKFEIFRKICLSKSGHQTGSWQPSWSVRTALLAAIGYMPTQGNGTKGILDYSSNERQILAWKSLDWKCSICGSVKHALKPVTEASKNDIEEAKELAPQIDFQGERKKKSRSRKAKEKKAVQNDENSAQEVPDAPTTASNNVVDEASSPNRVQPEDDSLPDPSTLGLRTMVTPKMGPNQRRFPLIPPQMFRDPVGFLRSQGWTYPKSSRIRVMNNSRSVSSESQTQSSISDTSAESGPFQHSKLETMQQPETNALSTPELHQRSVHQDRATSEAKTQLPDNNKPLEARPGPCGQQNSTSSLTYLCARNFFLLLMAAMLVLAVAFLVARRIFVENILEI